MIKLSLAMQTGSKYLTTVSVLFALLICSVSPSPGAGDCDTFFCSNVGDVLKPLWDGIDDFNLLWPLGNAFELPPVPLPGKGSETPLREGQDQNPSSPPVLDPQIEILEEGAGNSDTQRCSSDSAAQQGGGCDKATLRLVFPLSCQEMDKNAITEQKISGMDHQYKSVLDPACSVEGGVLFWKGRFTNKQSQSFRSDGFVKSIMTNVKAAADVPKKMMPATRMKRQVNDQKTHNSAEPDTPIPHPKSKIPNRDNTFAGHVIDKRNNFEIVHINVDDVSLNYLSTAPGKVLKKFYTFGFQAGSNVLVIVLDNKSPRSIYDIGDEGRILSRNADRSPDARDIEESFGECTVSKIGGIGYGVAWHTQFALFEVSFDFDDFLLVLASIAGKLQRGEIVPLSNGAVMNIRMRYIPISTEESPDFAEILKFRMKPLIQAGIIIVTSSGPSQDGLTNSIDSFPARLALDIPIISVGFVDPGGVPIGPHGPGVSVFAPIFSKCRGAPDRPEYYKGSGIAVGIVTGLVAYYLSVRELKDQLTSGGAAYGSYDWVREVIAYVQRMGYRRGPSGEHTVWNGHDNDDPSLSYLLGPLSRRRV